MKVTFIHPLNFFQVQGSAEPYYVYQYLRHRCNVLLITSSEEKEQSRDELIYYIPKKKSWLPYWLYFDLRALKLCLKSPFKKSDLVYVYKVVIYTPLIMKLLFKCRWVYDFQAAPIEQEREFSQISGTLTWPKRAYLKGMKWLYRWGLRYCDLVITLSEPLKEILVREYGVDPGKIYIQPLGVDLELFYTCERSRFNANALRLLYVTSLGMQRGIQTVFGALRLLKNRGMKFQLVLVGSGPEEVVTRLRKIAEEEDVADFVVWKGFVPHNQIPALLETCDIALCPLPDIEAYRAAFPTKVLEYLAVGKIIIASDIPSNRSVICHRWNGFLVPPNDPIALADAVIEICRSRELQHTLIRNARDSIRKFDWKIMLPKLERKLRDLLNSCESTRTP